jgi:alpha-glucosidase
VHLWTGKRYRGGRYEIDAPFGKPPVFYREASRWTALFEALMEI